MNRIRWYGPTLVLLMTMVVIMVGGPSLTRDLTWHHDEARIRLVSDSLAGNQTLKALNDAFRQIGIKVEPSVVHIQVATRKAPERQGAAPDSLRRWFFGPNGPEDETPAPAPRGGQDMDKYNPARPYASGSGWVYDDKGHIITNNHVVDGADVITVRFHDGAERTARVVGTDPKTDVAVLQVDDMQLHKATVAKDPVQQGDIVFAFGSPFGFKFSMSQGIVSALGRNELHILSNQRGYEDFIQTDAAINPGNSGGPLTNVDGDVIGMNTAIATNTGAFNGLGFAIPIDHVVAVVDALINRGKVVRGYLGIIIKPLDPKMGRTFGYTGDGVLLDDILPGGPAATAGFKPGDIINKINGKAASSADQLREDVAAMAPGTKINVEIFREGKTATLTPVLGELPETVAAASGGAATPPAPAVAPAQQVLLKIGIERATPMTDDLAKRVGLKTTQGIAIEAIRENSAAAIAQLGTGTIITEVQGVKVNSVPELVTELEKYDLVKGVRLRILVRDGTEWVAQFVLVELPG